MTTKKIVDVEQSLQKLRYNYHFQITLKNNEVGFHTEVKFTENQIQDVQDLINTIKVRKNEAIKVLTATRERFTQTLIEQQKFCTDNYDAYMNGDEAITERWIACLTDFSHSEMMLSRDFDYGLNCINKTTELEPYYGCPDNAPMFCRFCERRNNE